MKKINWLAFVVIVLTLQSCEFNCSVGKKDEANESSESEKDGTQVLNNIDLKTKKVNVSRAFLSFKDGTLVPKNNRIDFSQPVVLHLNIEDGWVEEDGRAYLGVSEKITDQDGSVILDEEDLFGSSRFENGVSASDAKVLSITANISLPANSPPASFTVSFRVWDKKGDGFIEGSYKLKSE